MRQILNYGGGKRKLAKHIIPHFPEHRSYVEAFGGSGAILLAKPPAPHEVYNDLDGDLANLFRVLRDHPDELRRRLDLTPYGAHDAPPADADDVTRAWWYFVCTNTRWKGSGGPGTGPLRRDNSTDGRSLADVFRLQVSAVDDVARRLVGVKIENMDAVALIERYDGPDALVYADPPYLGDREATLYRHEMTDEAEHRRLLEALNHCDAAVVLSGYPHPLYDELLADWTAVEISGQDRSKQMRAECLWIRSARSRRIMVPVAKTRREATKRARRAAPGETHGRKGRPRKNVSTDGMETISVRARAAQNGVSPATQHRLDVVARIAPDVFEAFRAGRISSVREAERLARRPGDRTNAGTNSTIT